MVEVLDHSTRQARSLLNEAGFVVDSIQLEPYEFDDLVLDVRVGNSKALPGEKYPIRTHVTLVVGSTQVEINPENDESEEVFFE